MGARKKYLLLFLSIAFVILAAWFLEKIVIYLMVAGLLSLLASPLNAWLNRQKAGRYAIPTGLSAFLSLLFIYALVLGVIGIFIPLLLDEAGILMRTNPAAVIASLHEPISRVDVFMNRYCPGQFSSEQFLQAKIPSLLNAALLGSFANSFVGFTGGLFIAFFAVSFFTFFFLKDGVLIFETLMLLSPPSHEQDIRQILHNCKRLLGKYFSGLCLDSLCVAVLITLGMYCCGVPNALIIGLFAGIVNVIPYIGVFIAASFGLFVAISTGLPPDFHALLFPLITKVLLVFLATNLIDSILFQPLIFSKSVKAHPLEIFLIIMITGTLAGIGPMILAVPLYTVLRVIAKQFLSRFRIVRRLTDALGEPVRKQHP